MNNTIPNLSYTNSSTSNDIVDKNNHNVVSILDSTNTGNNSAITNANNNNNNKFISNDNDIATINPNSIEYISGNSKVDTTTTTTTTTTTASTVTIDNNIKTTQPTNNYDPSSASQGSVRFLHLPAHL